jgi:signal transduction histidine kinase
MDQSVRILLIDDDQEDYLLTRDLLTDALGSRFVLDWVSTYENALNAIVECQHDIYLLDFRLGKRTGLELLREPQMSKCDGPVILLTGQGEIEVDREAMQAGASDYLTKDGLTAETLERTIRHSLERFHAKVELRRLNEALESRVEERTRDLEKANAALKEADRKKDEFLAILAHELRNPLAPIANSLGLLNKSNGDGEIIREARETMERQLLQMTRLVDDLLEVSRISRGKIELRVEEIDLNEVARHAVETAMPMIERNRQSLKVHLPQTPIRLGADFARIAQVIANLLNNASKFTDAGGTIELSIARDGDCARIRIRDTGIGMTPEALGRIFEMFAQVDSSIERSQGGLGIGLTLAKTLVELHGGSITALSDGPGRGSEFQIRLPAASAASAVPHPPPPPASDMSTASPTPAAAKRKILIVDDNRDSATTLAMLLKLSGQQVEKAHDGLQALEVAEKFLPDVILLDIGLPKLTGYEVVQRLRKEPWGQTMKVVALTGWGQEEDRQKSREAGFDEHLVKPVQHATLLKLLSEL